MAGILTAWVIRNQPWIRPHIKYGKSWLKTPKKFKKLLYKKFNSQEKGLLSFGLIYGSDKWLGPEMNVLHGLRSLD